MSSSIEIKPAGAPEPLFRRALRRREAELREAARAAASATAPCPPRARKAGWATRRHAPLAVGDKLGAWEVVELLGRGYRGRTDMRVAIVCTCGRRLETPDYQARVNGKRMPECRHGHALGGPMRPAGVRCAVCRVLGALFTSTSGQPICFKHWCHEVGINH